MSASKPKGFEHITTTLAHVWYDQIASGAKKVEFREGKPYWDRRLLGNKVKTITFSRGYTSTKMTFEVRGVHRLAATMDEIFSGKTLKEIPLDKVDPDSTYAIHLGKRIS